MKRFLADAILICILVSIGSYINQQGSDDTRNLVQEQVAVSYTHLDVYKRQV